MNEEDKEYYSQKLREDFDSADHRFRGDFQRYEHRLELIEKARRLNNDELVKEMKSDLKVI
jgi:hypothetical protein